MIYLALDPAASTGWACSDGRSGVRRCPNLARYNQDARMSRRAGSFQEWLADLLTDTGAAVVVCERGGAKGGQVNLHYCTLVAATCDIRDVCFVTVHPSTWQSWAKRHHGWTREAKSDEADARAILAWGLANVQPEVRP